MTWRELRSALVCPHGRLRLELDSYDRRVMHFSCLDCPLAYDTLMARDWSRLKEAWFWCLVDRWLRSE